MPNVAYRSESFPPHLGPSFQGVGRCRFTWDDLLWAAITVGRKNRFDVLRHGQHSWWEIFYRAAMLRANLKETPRGLLARTEAFKALDPSEKSAVSYFFGLTFSKLLAAKCLNVPWLMHLEVYKNQL